MQYAMKRLRHFPIVSGPTPSRVVTTTLLGLRSQAQHDLCSQRQRRRERYGRELRAFISGNRQHRLRASGADRVFPSIRIPDTHATFMLRICGTEH